MTLLSTKYLKGNEGPTLLSSPEMTRLLKWRSKEEGPRKTSPGGEKLETPNGDNSLSSSVKGNHQRRRVQQRVEVVQKMELKGAHPHATNSDQIRHAGQMTQQNNCQVPGGIKLTREMKFLAPEEPTHCVPLVVPNDLGQIKEAPRYVVICDGDKDNSSQIIKKPPF